MLLRTLTILSLTACAACGPRVSLELPPAELATCAGEPEAPDLPSIDWSSVETARPIVLARDKMMLAFALDMRSAWGDCKGKVDGLAAWRETAGD